MSYREKIEAKITGNTEDRNRRIAILDKLLKAFDDSGRDGAASYATTPLNALEKQSNQTLTILEGRL